MCMGRVAMQDSINTSTPEHIKMQTLKVLDKSITTPKIITTYKEILQIVKESDRYEYVNHNMAWVISLPSFQ